MLNGLSGIAWGNLCHRDGTAENIPARLRALTSDIPSVRSKALADLSESIVYYGTVYQATPYVVPFLIEMAASPTVADRARLLQLLATLASPWWYTVSPGDVYSADDDGSPEWHGEAQTGLTWVGATHRAVLAGIPVYVELLRSDGNAQVRAAVTCVLAECTDLPYEMFSALTEDITKEPDPAVQVSRFFAASRLLRNSRRHKDAPTAKAILPMAEHLFENTETHPLARTVAALALFRLGDAEAAGLAETYLKQTLRNPEPVDTDYRSLLWSGGVGIVAAVCETLAASDRHSSVEETVGLVLDAIPPNIESADTEEIVTVALSVLRLLDMEVRNPGPYAELSIPAVPSELTPFQREMLLRLCDTFDRWEAVNTDLVRAFRRYGLPSPEQLRHFLNGTEGSPLNFHDPFVQ